MSANVKVLSRAIRAKCLDCCGGMRNEVRDCRLKDCPLWPHRGAGDVEGMTTSSGAARHRPGEGDKVVTRPPWEETTSAGLSGQVDLKEVFEMLKGASV